MSIYPDEVTAPAPALSQGQGWQWSAEQEPIFEWFEGGDGNLVVRARAGTGKTTTIIEGFNRAPERRKVVCAFNKRIQLELERRINVERAAKTIHGIGYGIVLSNWSGIQLENPQNKKPKRGPWLTDTVCARYVMVPFDVLKLITKLHTKAREMAPHARTAGSLANLAIDFDCEPGDEMIQAGYPFEWIEARALEAMELAARERPKETDIDFTDMIFLPVRNRWLRPRFDLVVSDEAQDLNPTQLEIVKGVCSGRIALVGDDRQSIYKFRGTTPGGLDRMKADLKAKELGLTTTYRCGKAIVAVAQKLVPDFKAADSNPEGTIRTIGMEKLVADAAHGDFILSRINAPLVSIAMSLLQADKRARVAGRDIGVGLKAVLDKIRGRSIPDLITKVGKWAERQVTHLRAAGREDAIEAVRDQADTLITMASGSKSVNDVYQRIDTLFTDDGLGAAGVITCSSVHKAKGLESERVFILADTLGGRDKKGGGGGEEDNIRYVAVTRAKSELIWVKE